ncbi:ABC transporter substrate-binding protein [Isoptericola variabilis]|uniref:ABC-type transporter, periplasmic subunit n=1 Tax=Isoptericola variabilis (strain 225) TaxID=743718 RepID=F6FXH6_ISOV2|nr:ABC transporter substrate-binding protein [Isoptericola variabilis]AEG44704.1 ABC-type transporter, periplasmic subunit [Isoptericola variabilis 225]TWH33437.1 iron complex transport system substrate-binding protein [Isoptericola variabilis J7]
MRLRRSLTTVVGLAAATALTLAGCASSSEPGSADASPEETSGAAGGATDEFPITIEHAFGETVVEAEPERVATWGWGSTEAAVAAGVYPVAVAEQVWTVGEDALLPWVEEAYDEAGVEHPVILSDPEGGATVPYEEFVEVAPDLIVAPYSGLTQEQYDLLSEIAPVVAYPEAPWQTEWDDIITITADSLGRSAAGEQVVADIEQYLADEAAAHPEFEGVTFAAIVDSPSEGLVYVYDSVDPRAGFLEGLGLEIAPAVSELSPGDGSFFYTLSYEELDKLESDVIVSYTYTEEQAAELPTKPELQALPAVADGKVVQQVGQVPVSAVSPPTALSVTWPDGMPALVDSLAEVLG